MKKLLIILLVGLSFSSFAINNQIQNIREHYFYLAEMEENNDQLNSWTSVMITNSSRYSLNCEYIEYLFQKDKPIFVYKRVLYADDETKLKMLLNSKTGKDTKNKQKYLNSF